VTFSLPDHWVWDFWIADDGDLFHLYYLHAPTSLGDPDLRHRNAAIGHASSRDLVDWTDHGWVIGPGQAGEADATASWTGSVIRDGDGPWRMFYTGSRFLSPDSSVNVESVVTAESADLQTWRTAPGALVEADPAWYEVLADGTWHELAWRDPWVVQDPATGRWHMLITARARLGTDERDRGVVGHAVSDDLVRWEVRPPLSKPGAGFAHLEVVQWVVIEGRPAVLFSCDTAHLAGARAASGETGGVWAVPAGPIGSPIDTAAATRVIDESVYAGRAVQSRSGEWVLLGFENLSEGGEFIGRLSDPVRLRWNDGGRLLADAREAIR